MADQRFNQQYNSFWIDLHKCITSEAVAIVNARIEECHQYGIEKLEIIYGTPDRYEGSIQAAISEIVQINHLVNGADEIHAGIIITIKDNPNPSLQDEGMFFRGFEAAYENRHRTMEHTNIYYPLRKSFTTFEISKNLNCPIEYVRNVANNLSDDYAESKTVYNQHNYRDETTWYIYKAGYEFIQNKWKQDKDMVCEELKILKASDVETDYVLKSFKTPLSSNQKVKSRVSAALKRCQGKIHKKEG